MISNRRVTHKPSKVVHVVFETRIIFIDNMLNICRYLFEAFQYISCVLSRFKRAKNFLNYSGCSIKVVNAFIMLHHPIIYETASQVRSMQATSSITTFFPTFDPTFFCFFYSFPPEVYFLFRLNSTSMRFFLSIVAVFLLEYSFAFQSVLPITKRFSNSFKLQMIELEANTATYIGMFVATMVPSLALG